jgi:hypothetical protein
LSAMSPVESLTPHWSYQRPQWSHAYLWVRTLLFFVSPDQCWDTNRYLVLVLGYFCCRVYPNNSSNVHVTGYVSRMNKKDKAFYDKKNYAGTSFVNSKTYFIQQCSWI